MVSEGAVGEETFPEAGGFEELGEEDELSFLGDGFLAVPFGVKASAGVSTGQGAQGAAGGKKGSPCG